MNVKIRVAIVPIAISFIGRSLCVRGREAESFAALLPLSSFAASPTADFIMPADFIIPITPAVAIPPMPIWRA